ncbi:MAG: helix-turn-helix domain-containing protein [Solirubrobacteraceae bacterium]
MPGIGDTLREARMRAKIDVSEVEAATKIRAKYLRAIENEEWDLMPGPTFIRSFVRTYAEFLGLDAKLLAEEFKLRHEGVEQVDLQPIAPPLGERARRNRPRPPRASRAWITGLSVLGVIVALAVLGLTGSDPEPDPEAPTTAATPPPTTATARRTTPAPAPRPTSVSLQLVPDSEVYVCVRDEAGEQVVNATLTPDSERQTLRSKRFRVTVGNSAITLRVNGKNFKVPESADPQNFELTPAGRKVLPDDQNACEGG